MLLVPQTKSFLSQKTTDMAVHFNKVSGRRQSSVGSFGIFHLGKMDDRMTLDGFRANCASEASDDVNNVDISDDNESDKCVDDETILLNVGGQIFETFVSTLQRSPKASKLSNDAFLRTHYRVSHGDYFFDRDPDSFRCVLSYLRTGELHIPTHICGPVIKQELLYWGVDDDGIERCCWGYYNTWNSQNNTLDELEKDINSSGLAYHIDESTATPWQTIKVRVWEFLENPSSSRSARVYTWISILVVLISIFTFCAETHPAFKVSPEDDILAEYFITDNQVWEENVAVSSARHSQPGNYSNQPEKGNGSSHPEAEGNGKPTHLVPHAALIVADFGCLFFFTIEFFIRFFFSPSKRKFLSSPLNIIDIIAILPDYVELVVISLDPEERKVSSFVDFIFILRIIRILRVFRLIRHVPGLWILLFTLRASVNELILMMVFLMIGMLVFAALMYFAESHVATDFTNIPVGFWWSLVTMTTVGYGDVYPRTGAGYIVGALCALVGLLMLALTVPIIVGNFVLYYTHIQYILNRKSKSDPGRSTETLSVTKEDEVFTDLESKGSSCCPCSS